ncbi:hypothetical protein LIER_27168 [Lithospermum erythrorhizon]|uniref:NAC domain-containing protein n=1 Tax=Lithospermum erythrorhizon TaxID=34254 RepID=A0AAV3RF60_LITER
MENISSYMMVEDHVDWPPGFRFHPTDEELITHYLSKKVIDENFSPTAIGEVDMNKVEPWKLPWKAKMGEKEWYFFCVRDKKYPTGLRTNRATAEGYWKATGKDKEIFRGKYLVGMKKTLVFYKGRAPRGEKTNWVSHEYRLEGKMSLENLPKVKNDWVISRVFQKSSGGKKVHISGMVRMNIGNEIVPSPLPPLSDPPPFDEKMKSSLYESTHVHCFSNNLNNGQKSNEDILCFNNASSFSESLNPTDMFAKGSLSNSFQWGGQSTILQDNYQIQNSFPIQEQDPSFLRTFFGNYGQQSYDQSFRKIEQ